MVLQKISIQDIDIFILLFAGPSDYSDRVKILYLAQCPFLVHIVSVRCVLCITTVCIVMMVLGTIVEDHDISNYQPDIVQPPHTNLSITLT